MKTKALIGVLGLITLIGVGYYYASSHVGQPAAPITTTDENDSFKTYEDQNFGIQAKVPTDWMTKSSKVSLLITSPDFATHVAGKSIIGSGFVFQAPQEVSASLTNPDNYRQFIQSQKWSDGNASKEIWLGGEVAFSRQTSIACGMDCDDPDIPATTIETVHKGKIYYISFQYDQLTPDRQHILDVFLQSFTFLN
jgi:hypothetical protein